MRRRVLAGLFVAPIVVLSACGGGSKGTDVEIAPIESAATPSPSASPSEAPLPTSTPEAAKLSEARLGSSVAKTAEEKAVVEAWTSYWKAVYQTYGDGEPAPGLDVARGAALDRALDYLNELKSKNRRSVGWTRINVTQIEITGDAATLRDCSDDFSFEVDESDTPVEEVVPFFENLGSLSKVDGEWKVTGVDVTALESSCTS